MWLFGKHGSFRRPQEGSTLQSSPSKWLPRGNISLVAVALVLVSAAALGGRNEDFAELTQPEADALSNSGESEIRDLNDLISDFERNQFQWMPVAPPGIDFFGWTQGTEANPMLFNPAKFPEGFVSGLVPVDCGGYVIYPVTVLEDMTTREIVFVNVEGKEIAAVPPPSHYDPRWTVLLLYPNLYSSGMGDEQVEFMTQMYDQARLAIHYDLILANDLAKYHVVQDTEAKARKDKGGDVIIMKAWTGGSVTNIRFTAVEKLTNGMRLTIAYPDTYTNKLDIFSCSNLVGEVWWNLSATTNVNLTTNWIEWTDTSATGAVPTVRFYAAGNGDYDQDGDSIPDAREFYMYRTDPANSNSFPVSVSGSVSYEGQYGNGMISVVAVKESNSWYTGRSTTLASLGAYTNSNIPNQTNYWFKAYRDVNTNNAADPWEPWGWYSASATFLTTNLSGVNIVMQDPIPNINGIVSYGGRQVGTIYVIAVTSSNSWSTEHSGNISYPGVYNIPNLTQTNYWIKAFTDGNGDGAIDASDSCGVYSNNPVSVTNGVFNINLTMTDPDLDSDNCPDWWEVLYFSSITNWSGSSDPDNDGLVNSNEYAVGTDPTCWDTDGDGTRDGDDPYPLDPNYPPNACGTISYVGMQTGKIWVVAVTSSNSWSTNHSVVLSAPGAYVIGSLYQTNYWIKAWRDTDGNGVTNTTEARGIYSTASVSITNQLPELNITLYEDLDGDGILDYLEQQIINASTNDNITTIDHVLPNADFDGDGVSNADELRLGTDPTNPNSMPPRLRFSVSEQTVAEAATNISISVTVLLTPAASTTVSGLVSVKGGTATITNDYLFTNQTVVFTAGQTNKQVAVTIKADQTNQVIEPQESMVLGLSQLSGPAVYGTNINHVILINDFATDTDGDRLPDWWEQQYFGGITNAVASATNTTGWTNLQTYRRGCNPLQSLTSDTNNVLKLNLQTPLRGKQL